jgi:hypothetical protein
VAQVFNLCWRRLSLAATILSVVIALTTAKSPPDTKAPIGVLILLPAGVKNLTPLPFQEVGG